MSYTVTKVASADGTVVVTPIAGVGSIDLSTLADSQFKPTASKVAAYNAVASDVVLCNAVGGGFNVTLPVPTAGRVVTVKKTDASANVVTILPHVAETIDGAASFLVQAQWQSATLVADGTNWFVI